MNTSTGGGSGDTTRHYANWIFIIPNAPLPITYPPSHIFEPLLLLWFGRVHREREKYPHTCKGQIYITLFFFLFFFFFATFIRRASTLGGRFGDISVRRPGRTWWCISILKRVTQTVHYLPLPAFEYWWRFKSVSAARLSFEYWHEYLCAWREFFSRAL